MAISNPKQRIAAIIAEKQKQKNMGVSPGQPAMPQVSKMLSNMAPMSSAPIPNVGSIKAPSMPAPPSPIKKPSKGFGSLKKLIKY